MARPKGTQKNSWKYLNEFQLKAFKSALRKHGNLRDQVMMGLTLYLGLRVTELVNIRLSDIEWESRQITIQGIRGGRRRTYPEIEEKLWAKFIKYIKREKPTDRVFPLTAQSAKNIFKKYAKLAGLGNNFSIHCLRHTCAMLKAKRGDSPVKIMLWLRHRSIQSTQRYFEQVLFERESLEMNTMLRQYL